ncbi:MAG: hypothetical protein ACOVKL_00640 [Polynucleobacter sp.]
MKPSKSKKYPRYLIGDPTDRSPEYLAGVNALNKKGVGVLHLGGVQGNQPQFSTHQELLKSFQGLKVHYCQLYLEHIKATEELTKIHSAQFGNKGFLKQFGMAELHPLYFYRLVALRFNGLSKADLESLCARNAPKKKYDVKNVSSRLFQQHFRRAISETEWIDLPAKRTRNNLFALQVMAIGVIEDYLGRTLKPHEREDFIAESGPFLKKLEAGLIKFANEGLGYATEFLNPSVPPQGKVNKST